MFKKLLSLLILCCGLMPMAVAAKDELIVTSYGGAYQNFFEKELIPEFEKKYDCKVKLAVGLAKDWLAEMRASGKDKAPYDVLMLNEIWANPMRNEGYFADFELEKMPNLKNAVIMFKNPSGNIGSVIGAIQPAGIAYNKDKVPNPPRSWKEMWNPEYKNKLGLYTITNSLGAEFLLSTADVWCGDQHELSKAIDKINELKPFKLSEFSGDMEKQLTLGEVEIGVLDTPAIARLSKAGVNIGWIEPKEHMLMFEQVFSVHKASDKKDLAQAWINYIMSPEVQEKFMRRFYTTPTTKGIQVPEDLKTLIPIAPEDISRIKTLDWKYFNDNKNRLIREWNRKIAK